MFMLNEQLSAATKANLNAQLAMITTLTNKALENVEKVVDLNISTAKASLEESVANAKQLLGAQNPQTFFALTVGQIQPVTEKAIAYSRHLAGIATSMHNELSKITDTQITETNRKVIALVDDVTKNVPTGTESAVAIMKSAIGNANAGYEQLTKTTKQAVEAFETNLSVAAEQFAHVAERAAPATGRSKK